MTSAPQTGHGHGHLDATGKGHGDPHDTSAADPSGLATIGQPSTPMVHTSPVGRLAVKHNKLACPSCTARTWHAVSSKVPPCAHCGGPLDAANIGN
jgi:hypothetical protein